MSDPSPSSSPSPGPHHHEGHFAIDGRRFAIVVGRFNHLVSDRLLEGALDALRRHGARDADIDVVRVPGSFEIPLAAKWLADGGRFDAIICLGAVIRGGTPHFDYVAGEVAKGVGQVQLASGVPIAFGVLTTDTIDQAIERAGTKAGNKGWEAAMTAIEMADLRARLAPGRR